MDKILVPVDFSGNSLTALFYAIKLFAGSKAEITVLHSYQMSSTAFSMKSIDRVMEEDAQREMDALLKSIQKEEPDIILKPKIIKGNAISVITSMGDSGTYDFIVMGTKGASGLKEVLIGSVAGGVIAKTKAPVLVVPDNYVYHPLNEIIFAISGIPFSNNSVVEPLRKLVTMHGCKVNVLHISEDEKSNLDEVVNAIDDLEPSITYAFGTGNINERLNDYVGKEKAELLCLVRGKKGFFSRLFGESVTMKQTFSSSVPLLILHD